MDYYDDGGFGRDDDSSSSIIAKISGTKLAILASLIMIGGFFAVQAMFGFPIKDLIRNEVTDNAKVVIKDHNTNTCVVESSVDHEPRTIQNCHYNKGDTLTITYKQGTVPIEKYVLKKN
ncbi:MAG TPA: hypothetical protein VH500_14600 [Nitrososphaeraceae archaeon]